MAAWEGGPNPEAAMVTERSEREARQVAITTKEQPLDSPMFEGEVWCAACQRYHQQRHLHSEAVGTTIELRCPATGHLLLEL